MPQLEFTLPDFLCNNSAEEIHERMMNSLPDDIDDMPAGFPYDFTMPAANEKDELINFHLARVLMLAFPQFAWDEWLDYHGQQVHLTRHEPRPATGIVTVRGAEGTSIPAGTVFCTPGTDESPSVSFVTAEMVTLGEDGIAEIEVQAQEGGTETNVPKGSVSILANPITGITSIINGEAMRGGTDRETNDDFYDRIAAEYGNNLTYLGNDSDYIRWAKAAGAGDCIVIPAWNGPGTVKLVLIDQNGQPASDKLTQTVYDFIVSENDRSKRLLPAGCAELTCVPAVTRAISYTITGLIYTEATNIEQIKQDFAAVVKTAYEEAKNESLLRYNDVRPLIKNIYGVEDFETFLIDGRMENIVLSQQEYPETGTLNFS